MAIASNENDRPVFLPAGAADYLRKRSMELVGLCLIGLAGLYALALIGYRPDDPSINTATDFAARNPLGWVGATVADLMLQSLGLAAGLLAIMLCVWGWQLVHERRMSHLSLRLMALPPTIFAAAAALATLPTMPHWPLISGLGGFAGALIINTSLTVVPILAIDHSLTGLGLTFGVISTIGWMMASGYGFTDWWAGVVRIGSFSWLALRMGVFFGRRLAFWGLRLGRMALHRSGWHRSGWHRAERNGSRQSAGWVDPGRVDPRRVDSGARDDDSSEYGEDAWIGGPDTPAEDALRPDTPWPDTPREEAPWEESSWNGAADALPDPGEEAGIEGDRPAYYGEDPAYYGEDKDGFSDPAPSTFSRNTGPSRTEGNRSLSPGGSSQPKHRPGRGGGGDGRSAGSPTLAFDSLSSYEAPEAALLGKPKQDQAKSANAAALQDHARQLETVLKNYGVRGEIGNIHPGPVVTLYELNPAPGTKTSRVINLSEDIARSMSALSVRAAVIPGRDAIGIELPNRQREIVYLRDLLEAPHYRDTKARLPLVLGRAIGGEPVIVDLSRMPHLLVAGTTGSGKSVSINTMILSLLFRLPPDRCRLILVDPKMLELSVYDGIPHLLTPVVTDPKKAVIALKWTVREMESRYQNMSVLGVRNIEGYNARLDEIRSRGEIPKRRVQTGFDPDTGKPVFEEQPISTEPIPYIVVVVDEMADLMLVAGKEIEAAIQRLAQMARAAGIHLIMATQRPSVDVITGTIKANFPTRISFQVTSKIDSRTILGEQGAETLLGLGDMLYMAGGGRITRVHGPFVSDEEVEKVVGFLRQQGEPEYVDDVTEDPDAEEGDAAPAAEMDDPLYDQAVAVVCKRRRASTSYVQRELKIGYNRAARLIERMELEGVISEANHSGKREVLARDNTHASG